MELDKCARANFDFKKKNEKKRAGLELIVDYSPEVLAREEKASTTRVVLDGETRDEDLFCSACSAEQRTPARKLLIATFGWLTVLSQCFLD